MHTGRYLQICSRLQILNTTLAVFKSSIKNLQGNLNNRNLWGHLQLLVRFFRKKEISLLLQLDVCRLINRESTVWLNWLCHNRPLSIYQYCNLAPRLSGKTSISGVVFFVFETLLGIERQKKLKKFTILTRKPRSHVRILIYRTWPIIIWLCLTRTENYQVHEFDWLKWILTAV